MTDLQTKQLAFLEDTKSYYNSENRGVTPDNRTLCSYTYGCAIGRHIEDMKLREKLDKLDYSGVACERIFELLPQNLKDLGLKFLTAVQQLHDSVGNWCISGLSATGDLEYKDIKQKIERGFYQE